MSPLAVDRFDSFAASLGISFVPVRQSDKRAYHDDWTNPTITFTPDQFKPTDNVGGRWGVASGDLIDLDHDTLEACRIGRQLQLVKDAPRYGRPAKRASHYILHCSGAKTTQFVNPITGKMIIEIRATGSQSVLPQSTHESGEPYEWEHQSPHPPSVDFPTVVAGVSEIAAAALIASLWNKQSRHSFALALAGFFAKNQVPQERAVRLMQMVAIGAQDEESARRLRDVEDTYKAHAAGDEIVANFTELLGKDDAAKVAKTLTKWLRLEREQFHIYSEQTLLERPAAPFLAKNLLVRGSLVALVSPPDVGKTFLALDLVLSVAAGQATWLGQPLLQAGPVLYIIGEGAGRFKYRYLAWKQAHGVIRPVPFHWIDQPVPLIDEKAMRAFTKQATAIKPTVVVFDTLSRCLMGADENSQTDMGKAMARCDELRARTSAMVMLPHHTKKDGTSERGSSVLRASVDTVLMLAEDDDDRGSLTLTCDRQKDADPFEPINLRRDTVKLDGVCDEDGQPESSCVIRLAPPPSDDALTPQSGDEKRQAKIFQFVEEHPNCTKTAVADRLGGNKSEIFYQIGILVKRGMLTLTEKGRGHRLRVTGLLDQNGL